MYNLSKKKLDIYISPRPRHSRKRDVIWHMVILWYELENELKKNNEDRDYSYSDKMTKI